MQTTKLAAIHCRIAPGGALEVFKDLIEKQNQETHFSETAIFTIYSEYTHLTINNTKIKIKTALPKRINAFFQRNTKKKLPILGQIFDYRNLMFFYPLLMKIVSWKIKKYQPDTILISSFAIAKNIEQCKTTTPKSQTKTILYLHSPMQYIRSHQKEYQHKLKGRKGALFKRISPILKKRDLKYTKYDKIYSNSEYTKNLTKEIYNLTSEVKYPKINQTFFNENIVNQPQEYMVCIGRIVNFVREMDRIIKAFNILKYPLVVIGSGPDEKELKKIANDNISFTGRNPKNMKEIIKNAKGAINLTKESFGLSTAECLCLGVPVLGYQEGATHELVNNESGILISNKSEKEICEKFNIFIKKQRDRQKIAESARNIFKKHS